MATQWKTLNVKEISERAKLLSEKIEELDRLDKTRKESAQEFKKQIDALNREIRELGSTVRTGEEMQTTTLFDGESTNN